MKPLRMREAIVKRPSVGAWLGLNQGRHAGEADWRQPRHWPLSLKTSPKMLRIEVDWFFRLVPSLAFEAGYRP